MKTTIGYGMGRPTVFWRIDLIRIICTAMGICSKSLIFCHSLRIHA